MMGIQFSVEIKLFDLRQKKKYAKNTSTYLKNKSKKKSD